MYFVTAILMFPWQSAKAQGNLAKYAMCETKEEAAIKVNDCSGKTVIVWPLLWFDPSLTAHIAQTGVCVESAESCDLNKKDIYQWWLGTKSNPSTASMESASPIQFDVAKQSLSGSQDATSVVSMLASQIALDHKWVELAWRLGGPPDAPRPLLRLAQTHDRKNGTFELAFGTCEKIEVGRIVGSAPGMTWRIMSACTQNFGNSSELIRAVHNPAATPFKWQVEPATFDVRPLSQPTTFTWTLFPHKLVRFEDPFASTVIKRPPVVQPSADGRPLVVVTTPFDLPEAPIPSRVPATGAPSKQDKAQAQSGPLSRNWKSLLGSLVALVVGVLVLLAMRGRLDVLMLWRYLPTVKDRALNDPLENLSHGERFENALARLNALTLRVDSVHADLLRIDDGWVEWRKSREATEKTDVTFRKTTLEEIGRIQELFDRMTELEGLAQLEKQLDLRIDLRIREERRLWVNEIIGDSGALVFKTDGDGDIGKRVLPTPPPPIPADCRKIVGAMATLASFSGRLYLGWLSVSPVPVRVRLENALSDLGMMEFRSTFEGDIQSLRDVAFLDRLLWYWWLGESQPKTAAPLIESALRKWPQSLEGLTNTQTVALQWAQLRVPHIQTIVEAVPVELGSSSDLGLREAMGSVALSYSAIEQTDVSNWPVVLDAISRIFHHFVEDLYQSLGAEYYPIQLYTDDIRTATVASFLEHSHSGYKFKLGPVLRDKGLVGRHGVIVRVNKPIVRFRQANAASGYRWDGTFEYVEVPT